MLFTENNKGDDKGFTLPEKYKLLPPSEQHIIIRSSILKFLDYAGRGTASEISAALGAGSAITIKKQLQYLALTQQIYYDPQSKDPIYMRNGKLAHPVFQKNFSVGITSAYTIRTYSDMMTGKYLILTEYSKSPLGELRTKGAVKVDLVGLDRLISNLKEIRKVLVENPELLESKLILEGEEEK